MLPSAAPERTRKVKYAREPAAFIWSRHGGWDINRLEHMISLQHLTKRFGAQTAEDAISFRLPARQILGFLGPNGTGKCTTLKMLTGMLAPPSGSAPICGFDLLRE